MQYKWRACVVDRWVWLQKSRDRWEVRPVWTRILAHDVTRLPEYVTGCLSACPSVCLSVCVCVCACLSLFVLLSRPRYGSRVLWCVCLFVCVCISVRQYISGTKCLIFIIFFCMFPMAVTRSSCNKLCTSGFTNECGMTSCLHIIARNRRRGK